MTAADDHDPVAAARHLAEAIAVDAERCGRAQEAEAIRDEVSDIVGETATAVVVGERNQGKSSLVNALVGSPGLLPVGLQVASGVYVRIRHGPVEAARVVTVGDTPGEYPIALSDVADYAGFDPTTGRGQHDDVLHVEVELPSSLLGAGLAVVDTPGVGGLTAGHADITAEALSMADALIFVTSAASELTQSEYTFLHRAAERVGMVLFVLTQADSYLGADSVLARNRELVATHATRFADARWFKVSSAMKTTVDKRLGVDPAEPTTASARRLERSGFPDLLDALRRTVAGRAEALRAARALRLAREVAEETAATATQEADMIRDDTATVEAIIAERVELDRMALEDAKWRRDLGQRCTTLTNELITQWEHRIAAISGAVEPVIAAGGTDVLSAVQQRLEEGLRIGAIEMERLFQSRIEEITKALLGDTTIDAPPSGAMTAAAIPPGGRPPAPTPMGAGKGGSAPPAGGYGPEVPSPSPMPFAYWLAKAVAGGVADWAALVVSAALGVLLTKQRTRWDEARARESNARHYTNTEVDTLRRELPRAVGETVEHARANLETALGERLLERRAEVIRLIETREHHSVTRGPDRERQVAAARARAEASLTLHADATTLLRRLEENG